METPTDIQNAPDAKRELQRATDLLLETWSQGRRVLVVLGAGASVEAGIPRMNEVFLQLEEKLQKLVVEVENKGADREELLLRLRELKGWFSSLARQGAPRSIAAMALGMMQRAHETAPQGELSKLLHREWIAFSNEFIREVATKKKPTKIHQKVAEWAVSGGADLVSVNFDGLTRRALQSVLDKASPKGSAVVLSEPNEISRYFLGDRIHNDDAPSLVPVIKIWGDVFHAVCTNKQCPQSGIRAPIFRLRGEGGKGTGETLCPDCGSQRQLQIFFAGYEEKEKSAADSMNELLKFVAPRIGCIVTVGFSGLWDQSLVRFLAALCTDLDKERAWRQRLMDSRELPKHDLGEQASSFWINVDKDPRPPLLQDVASFGISPIHLPRGAEDFASVAPDFKQFDIRKSGKFSGDGALPEGKWEHIIKKEKPCPAAYRVLVQESHVGQPGYLADFALLRQLGIKTRIALAAIEPDAVAIEEPNHNRRTHSFGTAHLAILWFRNLVSRLPLSVTEEEEERLATVVMFAAIHHDIGHLPFTHLAEDIFGEVHWTVEDWSAEFHHDEAVLANCFEDIRQQTFDISGKVAEILGARPHEFRTWVEAAIQARSGNHWVDAILNSPLDTDKLDYVIRDCGYLRQGIHVPLGPESYRWLDDFFSNSRVLPGGLVALEGTAGEHARDFLEERRWLYKHQYLQPGYRALEKLAGSVILHWLLCCVPQEFVRREEYRLLTSNFEDHLSDTRSLKGRIARQLLWAKLKESGGESELLMHICEELARPAPSSKGLPPHPRLQGWARRCLGIFESAFKRWHPRKDGEFTLAQHLAKTAGVTCSEIIYVPVDRLKEVRESIRQIETLHPFRALVDVAVVPRMLSYPQRRRLRLGSNIVHGECFAVSHRDPDRWGMSTGRWIPLSESAFAERDSNRWAKIMVVSPESNDPDVPHTLDRFRNLCREQSIPWTEVDPDEGMT